MKITDVRVFPVQEEKVKAYVTLTLDRCLVIRDLKVIENEGKCFVAMPAKKRKDGTFRDTVHPLDLETRNAFQKRILDAYRRECKKIQAGKLNRKVEERETIL